MSWELVLINVLAIACIVLAFTTYNLMVKNEKLEDITLSYRDYLKKLQHEIDIIEAKIKKIDHKGIFQSDDEIGWFFRSIKAFQESISKFKIDL